MPRKKRAYSITKSGQIVIHDAEALTAGMARALERIDAITGEDDWEWGDPDPTEAAKPEGKSENRPERNGKGG